jgi:hypothetical protein
VGQSEREGARWREEHAGEIQHVGESGHAGDSHTSERKSGRGTRSHSSPVPSRSPTPTGEVAAGPPPSRAAACAGHGHPPPIGAGLQHPASSVPPSSCSVQSPSVPLSIKQAEQHIWRQGSRRERGGGGAIGENERGVQRRWRENWEFER